MFSLSLSAVFNDAFVTAMDTACVFLLWNSVVRSLWRLPQIYPAEAFGLVALSHLVTGYGDPCLDLIGAVIVARPWKGGSRG